MVFIPKNFEEIKNERKTKRIPMILSPFMYMNYEDAIQETIKIFHENFINSFFIVDSTGLTLFLLKNLQANKTNNHSVMVFYKNNSIFVDLNTTDDPLKTIEYKIDLLYGRGEVKFNIGDLAKSGYGMFAKIIEIDEDFYVAKTGSTAQEANNTDNLYKIQTMRKRDFEQYYSKVF